jgi:hypothetical protein
MRNVFLLCKSQKISELAENFLQTDWLISNIDSLPRLSEIQFFSVGKAFGIGSDPFLASEYSGKTF